MYIYKITNILNNKIYIGQCNGKSKSYFGGGKLLKVAIKEEGIKNFKKEIIVDNIIDEKLINELEKYYISLYSSCIDEIGYNIRKGGKGASGFFLSEQVKERMSKRMMGNKIMLGKKLDESIRIKQSASHRERLKSIPKEELTRRANKAYQTRRVKYDIGKLVSEGRQRNKKLDWNNKQSKPIIQKTVDEDFVKLWASAYQVQKELGWSSSHISGVCRSHYDHKTFKNYKWYFANSEEVNKYKLQE